MKDEFESFDWLHAVRAFIIMMIVFGGFSCIVNFISQFNKNVKTLRVASALLFFLAGMNQFLFLKRHNFFVFYYYNSLKSYRIN